MKRGGSLTRKTPLTAKKPLVSRTQLRSRSPLLRRSELALVSRKRLKVNQERRVVVAAMRDAMEDRCPRCRVAGVPLAGHERLARAHGGDVIHPDVLICNPCNTWCEDHPRIAAYTGWKISAKWPHAADLTVSQAIALDGSIVEFTLPEEVA